MTKRQIEDLRSFAELAAEGDEGYRQLWRSILRAKIPEVIAAGLDVARTPDYHSYNDRRLLLEIAGVYEPTRKVQSESVQVVQVGHALDDPALQQLAQAFADRLQAKGLIEPASPSLPSEPVRDDPHT